MKDSADTLIHTKQHGLVDAGKSSTDLLWKYSAHSFLLVSSVRSEKNLTTKGQTYFEFYFLKMKKITK